MTGSVALPRVDGEVALDEPWQGRAVGLAVETVRSLGLPWDAFRLRLVAAIADDPHRPYYDSWLIALERLATEQGGVERRELDTQRTRAASYRTTAVGHDDLEVFPIVVNETTRAALASDVPEAVGHLADCAHAELHRQWIDGGPRAWFVRLYDGAGTEVLTVELGSPVVDARWDQLRGTCLGLLPDPLDHAGGA